MIIDDKSYPTYLFSIARQPIARQATVIPVVGVVEVVAAAAVVAVVVQVNVSPASRSVQSAQSHQAAPVPHHPLLEQHFPNWEPWKYDVRNIFGFLDPPPDIPSILFVRKNAQFFNPLSVDVI